MILGLAPDFTSDAVERRLPDVASAVECLSRHGDSFEAALAQRRQQLLGQFGHSCSDEVDRHHDAVRLGLARFGMRHGHWGDDFHPYHNEHHAQEILFRRIDRLLDVHGLDALPLQDWLALALFAVCHDLRQREAADFSRPVGNNEAASISETARILDICGFDASRHHNQYVALELMIAGSTFDPRPAPEPSHFNAAEVVTSGGALAPDLPQMVRAVDPALMDDPDVQRGLRLALIASDLDTANVGEAFPSFAESSARLCREREMLAGRGLDNEDSLRPCLGFLSNGQEHYFFRLHRFHSTLGRDAYANGKAANAERLRRLIAALREEFEQTDGRTGNDVLMSFSRLSLID
ncbi:MAG: hypothetical protein KDI75_06470 [Xanthomonadales bacterium]|nr:hypothetical protein [Xanthomonadales bacterium]